MQEDSLNANQMAFAVKQTLRVLTLFFRGIFQTSPWLLPFIVLMSLMDLCIAVTAEFV
jgi:hypothetical protein